jgi:hypothetical protein
MNGCDLMPSRRIAKKGRLAVRMQMVVVVENRGKTTVVCDADIMELVHAFMNTDSFRILRDFVTSC